MSKSNGDAKHAMIVPPDIPCEECPRDGEYLCVGCDRYLCREHYVRHECDGSALGESTPAEE
jgi:hypothetical protein